MDHIEVEVKFHIDAPAHFHNKLIESGAISSGRFFEENIRFDTPTGQFKAQGKLIRLRRDASNLLTIKIPHESSDTAECKAYREMEVTVSDFQTMRSILLNLGFSECQVYEKWRETLEIQETIFCIDELPYGHFIEIEGTPESIRSWTDRLGLDWHERITSNYLTIFERLRTEKKLSFNQLTFDNFTGVPWNFSDISHAFTPCDTSRNSR